MTSEQILKFVVEARVEAQQWTAEAEGCKSRQEYEKAVEHLERASSAQRTALEYAETFFKGLSGSAEG
jgi:hypothetical protein